MYALFARLYGNNNLPDSSNMCHESTSVGLPLSIGVPVGTIMLEDFKHTDCIVFFGHNTGVNAPRAASGRWLHRTSLQHPGRMPCRLLPECNPLVPLSHHAEGSFVPAGKGVPVRLVPAAA